MTDRRLTKEQILEKLNGVLKDDWGLEQDATLQTRWSDANINPGAGDLQALASSVLGSEAIPDQALQACQNIGALVDLIHGAQGSAAKPHLP